MPEPRREPNPVDDARLRALILDVIGAIAPEARKRSVSDDADLREALDLDSMDFLNIVRALQVRAGVEVAASETPRLYTLTTAVALLRERGC